MSQFRFEKFVQHRHDVGVPAALVQWVDDQSEEKLVWMSPADIRSNVLLHGPHYGLLVAASHYHMKADQLVALHRSKGKNKTFLQPVEPIPSRSGLWLHPDYPVVSYGGPAIVNMGAWLNAVGYEERLCCYERSLWWMTNTTAEGECFAGCAEAPAWPLDAPEGNGWFIARIQDHEDGPACVWLRKLEVA